MIDGVNCRRGGHCSVLRSPRQGTKITLRKGIMGNYWFIDPRWTNRQASYIGRR